MPLAPSAPYDTLATVTAMVRTILGDYIQNIQPNNAGTVNVNAGGLSITWVSGNKFTALMNGVTILINNIPNTIAMVTSPTTATLLNMAAVAAGVSYSLAIPTGDIFADTQAYVVPTINLGWRKLQEKLEYASHPRMRNEVVLYSLPVVTPLDPAVQQYINWQGFFNGTTFYTPATLAGCPVLPLDFMAPLEIWERQSVGAGVTNLNRFQEMRPTVGRLPAMAKGSWNGLWDWREDALYFNGAILPTDQRHSYRAYLADIVPAAGGFALTPIPIMRCARAVAYYAAAEFVEARGSILAEGFVAKGDEAADMLNNRQAKLLQFANIRRRAVYTSSGQSRNRYW